MHHQSPDPKTIQNQYIIKLKHLEIAILYNCIHYIYIRIAILIHTYILTYRYDYDLEILVQT